MLLIISNYIIYKSKSQFFKTQSINKIISRTLILSRNNKNISSMRLIKNVQKNMQIKRTMHGSHVYIKGIKTAVEHNPMRSYTRTVVRLKKQAAIDLANDNTGKHPHVTENYCIVKGCENKKCPSLCDQPDQTKVLGHNTHKPPIGRIARFVDSQDANGNTESQYFVKTNKNSKITEQKKQSYGKDIKDDPKQTTYVQNHDDKYDN